ncbi:hypothetical protein J4E85_001086 [Alternaria conjuncta]|uniref:uncharacterized protein n=1 Tax=Alternaria conjuncta TaxID=181017 RepID=UPI002220D21E|nr:uncharacterized protein J4E85_001086 [Alternaria conjuncta]KAI4938645.1 hypothetical protein J4E85_001086 [Alternaria conjuncta]
MMRSYGRQDLEAGPLEKRAWTLQERYLARRFLAFMPHGITWTCKTTSLDEEGRTCTQYIRSDDWFKLLENYTNRALTVPSDRPKAIKGMAEEIQSSRKDRYTPEYGVWEEGLVLQLLWRSDGPHFDDGKLPHIPSWSWIATKDVKAWPVHFNRGFHGKFEHSDDMPEELVITPEGDLRLFGHLSTKERATSYARHAWTVEDLDLGVLPELHAPFYGTEVGRGEHIHHVITQDMHDACHQTVLGIRKKAEWEEVPNEEELQDDNFHEQNHLNFDTPSSEQDDDDPNPNPFPKCIIRAYDWSKTFAVMDAPFVEEQTVVGSNPPDLRAKTNVR